MKTLITTYTFNASTRQIMLAEQYDLAQVLMITNVTDNIVVYNFADPTLGGSMWAGTLTLDYDTSAMANTDELQIWVDVETPADTLTATIVEQNIALEENFISTASVQDITQRSLYDLLDSTHEGFVPLGVAPMGLDMPGQASSSRSMPVALANEQVYDANISAVTNPGTLSLGMNMLLNSGAWLDVSQYRSISMQINIPSGVTATLVFEGSNDGLNAVTILLYDMAAPATYPVGTATLTAGIRYFTGATQFRFIRARVSVAVTGGAIGTYSRLSMAPYSPVVPQIASTSTYAAMNLSQVASTGTVTAGVGGTLAVGGNVAPGAAPTLQPLTIGGTDTQQVGAGQPTVVGKVRRVLTDLLGNLTVTGPDPRNPMGLSMAPITVRLSDGDNGLPSIQELLAQILAELRVATFYLKELPDALNAGRPIQDDPTALADEFFNDINRRR